MKRHKSNKHGIGPMQVCELCGYSTVSVMQYDYHRRTHNPNFSCSHCDKSFTVSSKLKNHIDRIHPESAPHKYTCEQCGKTFIYEATKKQHILDVHQEAKKISKIRGKEGLTRKYAVHQVKDTPSTLPKFNYPIEMTCDYCEHIFTSRLKIARHYELKHPGREIILEGLPRKNCDQCNKVFFGMQGLKLHLLKVHGIKMGTYEKSCKNCSAIYVNSHKCQNEVTKCNICGIVLKGKANLKRHKKLLHGRQKLFCHICSKKCTSQRQLDDHIKSCHEHVTCDICQKTIRNVYDLKRHMAIVHDTSAFHCNDCPKKRTFTTKEMYIKHMNQEHALRNMGLK